MNLDGLFFPSAQYNYNHKESESFSGDGWRQLLLCDNVPGMLLYFSNEFYCSYLMVTIIHRKKGCVIWAMFSVLILHKVC